MFTSRQTNYILSVMTLLASSVMLHCDNNAVGYLSCEATILASEPEEPIKSEQEILDAAAQEYWEYLETRSKQPGYDEHFDILQRLNYTEFIGREHYTFPFGGKFGGYKYGKEYDKAIEYLREQLKNLKPWESQGLNDNMNNANIGYNHSGPAFHILLKQLGLALELNGQYEEALNVYMAVYSNDDLIWAKARIAYRLKLMKQEDPKFKPSKPLDFEVGRQEPLNYVVVVVNRFMPTLCIEDVLERTQEYQEVMQKHDKQLLHESRKGFGYLPVLKDTRDPDALAAYRFRDNCARIMCPSLDAGAILNEEHGLYAITSRIAYAEFLKYAEEEYQRLLQSHNESSDDFVGKYFYGEYTQEEIDKTMTLLRKIGELPF